MTNPLLERTEHAQALCRLDADAIAEATIGGSDTTIGPTRFVAPTESLSRGDLEAAAAATELAIRTVEARLEAVAAELERLPRGSLGTTETGTRVDFSG